MGRRLDAIWYGNHPLGIALTPVSWLFRVGAASRRFIYRHNLATRRRVSVPVIVVGNISVGGTGKTPLVIWLAQFFIDHGHRVAVICAGYRGLAATWPQQVRPDSDPVTVGDEAVLLARRTGCPVAAGPDRAVAAQALVTHTGCDLVISDDGLQHLALERDVEIAVIDGARRHGNGRLLPAGPLREPVSRLREVDFIVTNGAAARRGEVAMRLAAESPRQVGDPNRSIPLETLRGKAVHAVCGIGNPERFFEPLRHFGLDVIAHAFADHHRFKREDIQFGDGHPVLMTEKDGVKCERFAGAEHWYLPIHAELPREFGTRLVTLLQQRRYGQEAA